MNNPFRRIAWRGIVPYVVAIAALAFLAAALVLLQQTRLELAETQAAYANAQAAASANARHATRLEKQLADARQTLLEPASAPLFDVSDALATAHAALDLAQTYSDDLAATTDRLMDASKPARERLLRAAMRRRIAEAADTIPTPPELLDADPGYGINGVRILFDALPGPDGSPLRHHAEIVSATASSISVEFPNGTETYAPHQLHLGVLSYLPAVDPILAIPRNRWKTALLATLAEQKARRNDDIERLRAQLPEPTP